MNTKAGRPPPFWKSIRVSEINGKFYVVVGVGASERRLESAPTLAAAEILLREHANRLKKCRSRRDARVLSRHTPGRKWIAKMRDHFKHAGMTDRSARFWAESTSAIAHAVVGAALLGGIFVFFAHTPIWIVALAATVYGAIFEGYAINNYFRAVANGDNV